MKQESHDFSRVECQQEFNAYTDAIQNITLSVTPDESDRVVEKVAFAFVYGYNKNEMIIKNAMLNFAYDYQFGGNEENNSSSSGANSADAINEEIISESVSTAQTYMETNTAYNSAGNYITSETDEAGHTTSYSYDSDGNKTSVTDPKNNTTSYTYDTQGNILSVASGSSSYNNTYTSTGQLSTISNSGTSYSFEYDNFDNVTKVKVGNQTLVTNTYDSLCDKLTRVTYGNGQSLIYSYDDYGRITGINVHNGTMASYSYNKKGLITKYEDHWLNQTTYFFYDCNGNMIAKYAESEDKDLAFNISFDTDGNTVEQTNVNGRLQNIIRGTDDEENEYVSYDGIKVTTETDDFGRTTKTDTHYEGDLDYSPFYTTYGYKNGSATNSTTNIVNSVKHYTKTASNYPDHKIAQYDYTYDANGNITQVTLNDTVIAKYTYDSLNQLSTSADKNANEFVEYTYDTKGNITQKKNYSLTSSLTKGTLQDTKNYTYGDNNWGDKLTSYNGTTITYDNIGNPTSYRDGMTMSWMVGRSLSQITKSNKTYSFKYNADGLRTEKKCVTDGDTHHYYYDSNGNMIAFRRNNAAVVYFYYAFEGTKYFFIKNIQGDVEKIVTHQGNVAVTYKYDAWGKLISKTDNTVYGIGELNPFRYRSYIYDDETGLYYLKSRYYDPITGRFLNEDDVSILLLANEYNKSCNAINLFAYCNNNPISYTDPSGYVAIVDDIVYISLIGLFAIACCVACLFTNQSFIESWNSFCNTIGSNLSSVWNNICNNVSKVWNWSVSKAKSVIKLMAKFIASERAAIKVKAKVKSARKSKTPFYTIRFTKNNVPILGVRISREQAKSKLRQGIDTITYFRTDAAYVANSVCGNKTICHQKHHKGHNFFNHFHVKLSYIKHSIHSFYVIGG